MTRAFGRGSASLSATLQYSGILFSSLIGYWVWQETLSLSGVLGMLLIVASGIGATLYTQKHKT